MKRLNRAAGGLALATVLGFAACQASLDDVGFGWLHDYEQALQLAKERQKPLFAYLETDWCTYCRQMEATTLKDPRVVQELGPGYVWLKLNAESDPQGRKLRDRFGINSFPGMVIMTPDGEEVDRLSGYLDWADFISRVRSLTEGPGSYLRLKAHLAEDPDDAQAAFELGERHREREEFEDAAGMYAVALEKDSGNSLGNSDRSLYYQALMLSIVNRVADAVPLLDRLEREFPASELVPDGLVLQGQIYQHTGLKGKARSVLRRYIDQYPRHPYRERVTRLLAGLGGDLPMASAH